MLLEAFSINRGRNSEVVKLFTRILSLHFKLWGGLGERATALVLNRQYINK